MSVTRRDHHYHTYSDYLAWSRTHGDEVIDGAAYVREPPSPSISHQVFADELYYQIRAALNDSPCRVYSAPLDVRLPKATEEDGQVDTVLQPDVFIVSDLLKIDARGVRGAPDWVAEVLSPSTARYDRTLKLRAYERAGVREIWLVDPAGRNLTVYQLDSGCYGRATILDLEGRTTINAVRGVTVDWDQILARLP